MNILGYLSAAPAAIVAYLMICRLNCRKWHWTDLEAWAYLCMLGGGLFSFWIAYVHGIPPRPGKIMTDLGVCVYFGLRSLRISAWTKQREHKHEI